VFSSLSAGLPGSLNPELTLRVSNVSGAKVAYKVKTTAPKDYIVKPSNGSLDAGQVAEVKITMQLPNGASFQDAETICKPTKFLVQAFKNDKGEEVTKEMWSSIEKERIEEERLSVSIVEKAAAAGGDSAASRSDGAAAGNQSIKQKYDELIQYTLALEKEKKNIEDQIKTLNAKPADAASGFKLFHIILVALLSFVLSHVAKMVGQ